MKNVTILKYGFVFFIVFMFYLTITTKGLCVFANDTDRYFQDSPCFDVEFRCKVECDNYNLNYTGKREYGCGCVCNDNSIVSLCSGFREVR